MSGVNAIVTYATISFKNSFNTIYSPVFGNLIIASVNLIGSFIPIFLIERAGRRVLWFVSTAGFCSCLVALTCLYQFGDQKAKYFMPIQLVASIAHQISFNVGPGSVFAVLSGELYPVNVTPKLNSLSFVFRAATNIFVVAIFPLLADRLQLAYLCFLVLSLIAAVVIFLYLQETKGKSLAEIEKMMITDTRMERMQEGLVG